eukprot:TRINITY_DN1394_c0_g7_i1.p1 TRINITY_DN1394_c0_g7~~TRINITY_DN1394_c0_g7_i1.p1  ORF type:complete len:410 (+),score=86.92 TRINITY_DN1394_c0_g7_i1:165-1232(+)
MKQKLVKHVDEIRWLKHATSDTYPLVLFCPLLIFSVVLAVKMDFPERYSWMATFSPLWIFDFLMLVPMITYWIVFMSCRMLFIYKGNYHYPRWKTRWNFIYGSMSFVKHDSRWAILWRLFNTFCLCLWMIFTFLFPIALDSGDNLKVNFSFVVFICSGCYGLFIMFLVFRESRIRQRWDNDVGDNDSDVVNFTTSITFLSMVPAAFITAIMWFVQWRFSLIGSYTCAMIPMFISNALFVCGCLTPHVFRKFWIFNDFATTGEICVVGIGACIIISPFITFEVLLLYHMDQLRFLSVIVFIPLWFALLVLCCGGCFICCLDADDSKYDVQLPPDDLPVPNQPINQFNPFDAQQDFF